MTSNVSTNQFTRELLEVLEEAFESVRGYFLDKGTSLFETLEGVSAAEASVPVGGKCATLAAQVAHIIFYLEATERYMQTGQNERLNWGEVWRTVHAVTPEEWAASQARLKAAYARLRAQIQEYEGWETPDAMSGAIGLVAHTAYHLGEIRQALCTLKP